MNGQAREVDFGDESPSSSSNNTRELAPKKLGINNTEAVKQLTPRELAALKSIRRNVDTFKYGGFGVGAAGTWVLLGRRKTPPRMVQRLGMCVFGGLAGSFMLIPAAILLSKGALKNVEDPQHLRNVLAGAIEEKRQAAMPRSRAPPPQAVNGGSEQQQQQQSATDWGAASTYGSDGFANTDSSSSVQSSQKFQADSQATEQMPPGTGAGSRWAQLRGERGVEPSKWERIRQDSAREAHNRSPEGRQDQSWQYADQSQQTTFQSAGRSSDAARNTEPVMTLTGEGGDPRWSSPATFNPQTSGWGDSEFIDDAGGRGSQQRNGPRKYGVMSVVEEEERQGRLQGFQIESDAPVQVVKGSLLAALAGGVSGAVYGVMKGKQGAGTMFGVRMAANFFGFAFPFFAVREYLISPVLNRSSSGPDPANRNMRLRSVSNRHTDKLAASGLSGAVAGAGVAAYAKGMQSAHKGALTFGVVCMGLQLAGNEARLARNSVLRPYRPSPATPAALVKSDQRDVVASLEDHGDSTPIQNIRGDKTELVKKKEETESSFLTRLQSILPVRKISDEDYEKSLDERLQSLHQQIANIEAELREIEQQEDERAAPSDARA